VQPGHPRGLAALATPSLGAVGGRAGDAVILGASSVEQLVENVRESDGGALPAELIAAMDGAHAALNPVGHFLEMQQAQVMQL
jgi:aryl-alcohol dehydrogenase-like predicted oxidoreductase